MHRIKLTDYRSPHPASTAPHEASAVTKKTVPIGVLYLIGLLMAFQGGTLIFFLPKLFKELFGSEGLGGKAVFMFGVIGGLSSYFYAYLADRHNAFRVALFAQIAAIGPLIGFFYFPDAASKMWMMAIIGLTLGGTFPLMAALARGARGLTLGLRLALMLGGIWGMASLINLLLAQLPGFGFELERVLSSICLAPLALAPALFFAARRYET